MTFEWHAVTIFYSCLACRRKVETIYEVDMRIDRDAEVLDAGGDKHLVRHSPCSISGAGAIRTMIALTSRFYVKHQEDLRMRLQPGDKVDD